MRPPSSSASSDKARGVIIEYSDGSECLDGSRRRVIVILDCDPTLLTPLGSIIASNSPTLNKCEYEIYARVPLLIERPLLALTLLLHCL